MVPSSMVAGAERGGRGGGTRRAVTGRTTAPVPGRARRRHRRRPGGRAGAADRPAGMKSAMTSDAASARPDPTDEVVDLCRDLIRIDTTNTGDNDTSAGERAAAEYVAEKLAEVGLEPQLHESRAGPGQRGRPHPGRRPAPRRAAGARPPRRGARRRRASGRCTRSPARSRDGYLWGRGAVDMKDFDAMVLAVVRRLAAHRRTPAARHRARVHRRRGGRQRLRRALPGRASTPTCSRAAPRRSARSAASPTRSATTCGST